MAEFRPLFSGSSGNSTYIRSGNTTVLVDAGVSCKRLSAALQLAGCEPGALDAIFITHEHVDHISGLKVFLKRYQVPVYASAPTLEYLAANDFVPAGTKLIDIEDQTAVVGDIEVASFHTPHDCVCSLGYTFSMPGGVTVGVATDIGCYTPEIRRSMEGCDLVMLESNYDDALLACSSYPYHLKRRIKSDTGHLSNSVCAEAIAGLVRAGATRFVLAHLSAENNMERLAYQTTCSELNTQGMRENVDFMLSVADRHQPSPCIAL